MNKFVMTAVLSVLILPAISRADVSSIAQGTKENEVAAAASDVLSVQYLKLGKLALKIVSLDSALNGDLSTTTIVLAGQGEVGGAAGYDTAFKLTPEADLMSVRSAKIEKGRLVVTFNDQSYKTQTKAYIFDASTKTLKEVK